MLLRKKFLLFMLVIVLLPACSMKDAAEKMSLTLKRVQVGEVTPTGFNATVYMQVDNPNSFGVRIADLDYHVEVNGKEVAQGRIKDEIKIPASGSVVAELPVEVNYNELQDDIFKALKGKLDYRMTGYAVLKTWFGSYTLPFDTQKKHKAK